MDIKEIKISAALGLACRELWDCVGTCPCDSCDWQRGGNCEAHCQGEGVGDFEIDCWKTYFIEQVQAVIGADNA